MIKRILIARPDGIGDFIIFTAVLDEYRRVFPCAKIDILCLSGLKDMVEAIPAIDRKMYVDAKNILRKKYFFHRIMVRLMLFFRNYDILLCPVYSRNEIVDTVARWVRAKEKVAFDGDGANDPLSERMGRNKYFNRIISSDPRPLMEIDRNAEFINHLGGHLRTGSLTTKFWFTNSDQADCDKILQKNGLSRGNYICVFPGSGFRAKHWGTDNWLKFFEGFFCGYPLTKVVLLGGPRDKKVNDAIFARLRSRNQVIDLTGSLNLRVLAKVIAHSKLLVSTDTAAIHIAAAVGTPNVCIMGGGHFGRFYPYGDLSKNRIVHKQMDCYGCNWRCRYSSIKCIQDIDCEDVLKEVQKIL